MTLSKQNLRQAWDFRASMAVRSNRLGTGLVTLLPPYGGEPRSWPFELLPGSDPDAPGSGANRYKQGGELGYFR